MKIRRDDTVQIMMGKDKGKTGKVLKVIPSKNMVLVEGVNQFKRHMKARSQTQAAEIVMITKPVPVSNVMLMCPQCKLPTRIGYMTEKGVKSRMCRKCDKKI